jgi:hypothetical protein
MRPVLDKAADAVREHDADEIVPGKDEGLLDRPGRDDDVLGAEAVEARGPRRRERALPPRSRAHGRAK